MTALALTVFTGYALLDTFVIPRSYGTVPQIVDTAAEEVQALTQEAAAQETEVQEEIEQEEAAAGVSKKEFDKLSGDVNELKAMVKEIADGKHSA